jgi:putative hydrolase of the HAD superfamily
VPLPIQAVIFDFGGVIIPGGGNDAALGDPSTPFGRLEQAHGLPAGCLWKAHYQNPVWEALRVGDGTREAWLEHVTLSVAALSNVETAQTVMAALQEPRPPEFNPGILAFIGELRDRVKVGLLSNAAPGLEAELRQIYAVYDLFDDVINSATVRLAKPDPRIYQLAADRLGVRTDACFFTDDLPHNIEAARSVGMRAHQFDTCEGLRAALARAGLDLA